ncbi:hypothetical protein JZX76_05270 [Haloarcula hispanica]|uniref:DUF8163 domain-containing protein n=1 Tax=Haloarcula hispanica TaxID=51589 RepID=A0A482T922_HALHI|nr:MULTISPECIES: hypothetical protein [Haloarcula]AJF27157.1 hypothetical protein SG26_16130 [Haloarcula sp. CBA1115]KAA9407045.1 hypothetical protein Har1131_09610 [Haloarcula sp. CBA1131]KAA9409922.1 hypothetical protein EGO51_08925 [Haloarcula hispanica]MCJ0618949.1 hypothetical protein [Haloarcula hispanica]RYJ09487.1 hypothetical protein ELS20_05250 [Haloarcula hispanica]
MSVALKTARSRRSLPTVLGLLGIVVATGGLVWGGPVWLGFVGVVLGGLYLSGTPVLAVVLGQVALVTVDTPSLLPLVIVEGGLFLALLSVPIETPDRRVAGSLVVLVVPLLGSLAWLSLWRWDLAPLSVGATAVIGIAIVGYLFHRYLLIELDIVTEDAASDRDFL